MHVEIIQKGQGAEEAFAKELEATASVEIDARPLTYMGLNHKLCAAGRKQANPVVLLKHCSDETLKQLRRIRRNRGAELIDVTVYAFVEVSHA